MRVTIPDYNGDTPGGLVERDVSDEPVQKFINWLVSANRYTYENNPEIVVEKASRLRLALIAAARNADAPAEEAPESSGTAEITVKGLLALCDCESADELLDKVTSEDPARLDWLDGDEQRVHDLFGDLVNAADGETIRQLIDANRVAAPAVEAT